MGIIVFILLFSNYIIDFTYGAKYEESALILKILVFANIFSFLGAASSRWYINNGYERKIFYRNLFGVTFNIIGNILVIPSYGAIGAALVTIIAQVSANFIYDVFDPKTHIVFMQKRDALILKMIFIKLWRKNDG